MFCSRDQREPVTQCEKELRTVSSISGTLPLLNLLPSGRRIQFSSPVRFLGGPGMLRRTSLASEDFLMMTSFSRSAVCMRRTLDWFLGEDKAEEKEVRLIQAERCYILKRVPHNFVRPSWSR